MVHDNICISEWLIPLFLGKKFGEGPRGGREISKEDVNVIQQERSGWIKNIKNRIDRT